MMRGALATVTTHIRAARRDPVKLLTRSLMHEELALCRAPLGVWAVCRCVRRGEGGSGVRMVECWEGSAGAACRSLCPSGSRFASRTHPSLLLSAETRWKKPLWRFQASIAASQLSGLFNSTLNLRQETLGAVANPRRSSCVSDRSLDVCRTGMAGCFLVNV